MKDQYTGHNFQIDNTRIFPSALLVIPFAARTAIDSIARMMVNTTSVGMRSASIKDLDSGGKPILPESAAGFGTGSLPGNLPVLMTFSVTTARVLRNSGNLVA